MIAMVLQCCYWHVYVSKLLMFAAQTHVVQVSY